MLKREMPKKPNYPQHELAERLRHAMEEAGISLAELSRACGVTIQAVHDWRMTGRIGKQHLVTIARLTRKPLEYFLVGLGRAAAMLVLALCMMLQPQQAEASGFSPFNSNTHCMLRLAPFVLALLRRVAKWLQPDVRNLAVAC